MDISQIRYVYYVAKYRNFSQAAEHLFVTQPTLSQQVRRLEEQLGFPLFVRSTRWVTLTREGEAFVKRAKPLLEMYDGLITDMEALRKGHGGKLSVGLMPTFMDFDVSDCIRRFQDASPDVDMSCEVNPSDELIKRLVERKYDVVIAYLTPYQRDSLQKRDISVHILASDHINVALHQSNPLSSRSSLTLEDLRTQTVFMLEKRSAIERVIYYNFQQDDMMPRKLKSCPAFRSMLGSVALNQGVCFHSSGVGSEYIHPPLVSLPLEPEVIMLTALMHLKDAANIELIERFCDLVGESFVPASNG